MGDSATRAACWCWSVGILEALGDIYSLASRDLTYSVEGGDLAEPGDTQSEAEEERGEVAAEADLGAGAAG